MSVANCRTPLKIQTFEQVNLKQFVQPSPESLANATNNLKVLGALDTEGNITEVGIQMSLFPVDPEVARMLVASKEYSCQEDILSLAAMLSGDRPGSVFYAMKKDEQKFIKSNLSCTIALRA